MFKKCQVLLLPTNEKAILGFLTQKGKERAHLVHFDRPMPNILDSENQHLYFLSDEEIKEGDWYINTWGDGLPMLCQVNSKEEADDCNRLKHCCKKIIATTDSSLKYAIPQSVLGDKFNDYFPLPQPSQQFIEKYVAEYNKGNIIIEVMVEYDWYGHPDDYHNPHGIKLKINPKDNTITIRKTKDSWNREEVEELIRKAHDNAVNNKLKLQYFIEENL